VFTDTGSPQGVYRDGAFAELTSDEFGNFWELTSDGTPLGYWSQDQSGAWVFNAGVPLGLLPATGELSVTIALLLASFIFTGIGAAIKPKKPRKSE